MTRSPNAHDFDALLSAVLDGSATPDQIAQLDALLDSDDQLLEQYHGVMTVHAMVAWRKQSATARSNTPLSAAGVPMYRKGYEPQPFKLRPHHYALIAATLLAACGLAAYLLTTSVDPEPSPPEPSSPPPVATLIQNTGNLRTPHGYPAEGDDYGRGEYTLSTGTAEFMLTNSVNVKLRGNTRMVMRNDMNVALTRGSAEFVCPKGAKGFTVHLPDKSKIVDLGTAFKVELDDDGKSKLRVTEGSVEWTPAGENAEPVFVEAGRIAYLVDGRIATYSIPTVTGPIVIHDGSLISLSDLTTSPFADARNILAVASAIEDPADGAFANHNPDDLIDGAIDNNYGMATTPNADQWLTDQSNPTLTFTFDTAVDVSGMKIDWAWQDRTDGVYAIVINGSTAIGLITVSGNTDVANPAMVPTHLLFDSVQTGVTSIALVITGQDENTPALAEVTFYGSPQSQAPDPIQQTDPLRPQTQNRQRVGDKP